MIGRGNDDVNSERASEQASTLYPAVLTLILKEQVSIQTLNPAVTWSSPVWLKAD